MKTKHEIRRGISGFRESETSSIMKLVKMVDAGWRYFWQKPKRQNLADNPLHNENAMKNLKHYHPFQYGNNDTNRLNEI